MAGIGIAKKGGSDNGASVSDNNGKMVLIEPPDQVKPGVIVR